MRQIRYKVSINYTDFDNQSYTSSYEIFANDKDDARNIAGELFFMDYGAYNDMKFNVEPAIIEGVEKSKVEETVQEVIGVVKAQFTDKSYKEFLKTFENFDGRNLVLKPNYASFWFRFMDVVCKAIWDNGISYISEDEIVLYCEDNKVYVVRNNLHDIYKAY